MKTQKSAQKSKIKNKASKKLAQNSVKRQSRKYDNSSRAEKSAKTQEKIVETFVALLIERKGADVQIAEIAKRSEITERTIFRFFKDKKSLHEALDTYLLTYLQASAEQMTQLDFIGFAKNAFVLFDKHESLTMAYLFSPFGQEARALFRKKLNQAMIQKIVKERDLKLDQKNLKRLALVTSLVNAKIWYDVRTDYGFSGKEMGETIEWALENLLKKCQSGE